MSTKLQRAMKTISDELISNPEYFDKWKRVVASAFIDQYSIERVDEPTGFIYCPTYEDIIRIANNAAVSFVNDLAT